MQDKLVDLVHRFKVEPNALMCFLLFLSDWCLDIVEALNSDQYFTPATYLDNLLCELLEF